MNSNSLRLLLFLLIGLGSVSIVKAEDFSLGKIEALEETSEMLTPFFSDTLITQDSFFVVITDCNAGADICIDVPLVQQPDFTITVNGQPYAGGFSGCDFDTLSAYTYTTLFGSGDLGPYFLTSWDVSGTTFSGQFNNIPDLVDSMNTWDPMGNWMLDSVAKLIVGGNAGNTYSDMDVLVLLINSPSFIGYNFGVEANGMQLNFDVGLNEVIFDHNTTSCIDTFYATVVCTTPETVNRTVAINETGTYCIDFSELIGAPTEITNVCLEAGGTSVDFQFVNSNTCIDYRGLQSGIDSACIVSCDEFGVCDTTYLVVQVSSPGGGASDYIDEVLVGQSGSHCLRRDLFSGTPDTIYNICEISGGTNSSFVIDTSTYCITYTGNTVGGLDSACYVLCDNIGTCDTTYMVINVLDAPGGSRNITSEVLVTQSGEFCIDTTILTGTITQFYDDCPNSNGGFINFSLDSARYCINYTGLNMGGPDQACIIICDDLGACDTTNIIVTVNMPQGNSQEIYDTLFINSSGQFCVDTTIFAGLVDTLYNACELSSGSFGTFNIDLANYCVNYTADQIGGLDTACVYLQDELGSIDTTIIYLFVTAPTPDTLIETVLIGNTETICLDTTELSGTITSIENGCIGSSGTLVSFIFDPVTYCVDFTGATIGKQDTACLILTDDRGIKDTTLFIVEVLPPTPETIFDTIVPLQTKSFCLDTVEILLPVDTIYSICQPEIESNATIVLDTSNYCVSYTGLVPNGTDTLCYVLCSDRGICDTSYLYIYVQEVVLTPSYVYDTVTVNNSSTLCLESEELPTNIATIANDCPASSGEFVVFTPNNTLFCLNYDGMDLGTDTACMILTDELGYQDTLFIVVTVSNPRPETILDTILIGSSDTYCIDTTELAGVIDTIYNICEDMSGSSVNFTLNDVSLCLDAVSLTPGIDSSCVVICDDFGLCDTTYYLITIVDNISVGIPVTVDDIDTTTINTTVVINALGNDQIPPDYDIFEIITGPSNGVAITDPLGTITYTPDPEFCGAADGLEYQVCNAAGCDTAMVVIFVECESTTTELIVYDGFSPNGDGVLDVFTIRNIERFPNHKLYIYNRWGSLVFQNESVTDKWDGKWEGENVPDGVYFYLLDDGNGIQKSGYLVLRR